jgi:hypothetical protein
VTGADLVWVVGMMALLILVVFLPLLIAAVWLVRGLWVLLTKWRRR